MWWGSDAWRGCGVVKSNWCMVQARVSKSASRHVTPRAKPLLRPPAAHVPVELECKGPCCERDGDHLSTSTRRARGGEIDRHRQTTPDFDYANPSQDRLRKEVRNKPGAAMNADACFFPYSLVSHCPRPLRTKGSVRPYFSVLVCVTPASPASIPLCRDAPLARGRIR